MTGVSGIGGRRIDGADVTLGVLALFASAGYLYETAHIPASLLEDAVGARGVPLAIGSTMAALGGALCLRGFLGTPADERSMVEQPVAAADALSIARRPHAQALGLLAILAACVALLPYAGYVASTALLIAAVAWFSGAPRSWRLPVIAIAGSVLLWVMFDWMLSVQLPAGAWWEHR